MATFIDEINLELTAGKGGDGVVRWRTEKFKPKAGPGGGNGGRGGSIFALAVKDLSYLSNYQHKKSYKADDGNPGENFGCHGASSEHLVLKFPVGTRITQKETGFTWFLDNEGQQELLVAGGAGGLGNEYFKSSVNITPTESTPGKEGESGNFHIELELFADIGLVGMPSAGKSSLLNELTAAKSKVAAYHFTTLEPHLGVMAGGLVIADIPGLIEGASDGKGLGHKFLRHIKRTKTLLHLVSFEEGENMMKTYETIRSELKKFDATLLDKQEIILLTKTDVVDEKQVAKTLKEFKKLKNEDKTAKDVIAITLFDSAQIKELGDFLTKTVLK